MIVEKIKSGNTDTFLTGLSTDFSTMIKISEAASGNLRKELSRKREIFCTGLFLSARWFVVSESAREGINLIILPTRESAEYAASDLYNLTEGDCVFYLPDSGKAVARSNYKSSLSVQRTSAVGKIMSWKEGKTFIVTYPEALEEGIPPVGNMEMSMLTVHKNENAGFSTVRDRLAEMGFEKVDFVSAPGQYAVRGSVIDIFSYSIENPYRISFFGDEVDKITIFNCNTQLSIDKPDVADIIPDISSTEGGEVSILSILPKSTTLWLDSSDMYSGKPFFEESGNFQKVYIDPPLSSVEAGKIQFYITPQPVFNKNFDLLLEDISRRMEEGYRVVIFGEKEKQLDMNLYWGKELEKDFYFAARIIITHNIYKINPYDNAVFYYKYFNLNKLVSSERLINIKKDPLLYLLCLIDSIEPIKIFYDNNHLDKISIEFKNNSILIDVSKLTELVRCDYLGRIISLNNWLTDVNIINDNCVKIMISYD